MAHLGLQLNFTLKGQACKTLAFFRRRQATWLGRKKIGVAETHCLSLKPSEGFGGEAQAALPRGNFSSRQPGLLGDDGHILSHPEHPSTTPDSLLPHRFQEHQCTTTGFQKSFGAKPNICANRSRGRNLRRRPVDPWTRGASGPLGLWAPGDVADAIAPQRHQAHRLAWEAGSKRLQAVSSGTERRPGLRATNIQDVHVLCVVVASFMPLV